MGNPKSEIRDPKEARNPKAEMARLCYRAKRRERNPPSQAEASNGAEVIRISDFGFLSDFGLRISDFP